MIKTELKYYPRHFSQTAIIAFIIAVMLCSILFYENHLPGLWVMFATIEVFGFFIFTTILSKQWAGLSSKYFTRTIFITSLIIRVIWVIFSYFFFIEMTGTPFDFHTADALSYHNWALQATDSFWRKGFGQFFHSHMGYSDIGYPMYLTAIYLISNKSIIVARLFMALWSSLTAVLIYKLASRNFGESAGRISGIMAMLLPNFIYYCGLHLKEPLMIFLVAAFLERTDNIFRKKQISALHVLLIAILAFFLFFFRTVLGLSAIFALFTTLSFSSLKFVTRQHRFFISLWIIILFWLFFSAQIKGEIQYVIDNVDSQEVNMEWRTEKEGGNTLANWGSTVVFLPFMVSAPFPTFVYIDLQEQQMMMSGSNFIRNIYAFFTLLGLYLLYKRKLLRKYLFLISFLFIYLAILAKSSFALSERFHLPAVPLLIIFASYGIININKKNLKYYIPYLVLIVIIIIGWNWFKLAGRGLA